MNNVYFKCPGCNDIGVLIDNVVARQFVLPKFQPLLNKMKILKFCNSSNCKIVYFTGNENWYFTVDELTEKVTVKDFGEDVLVCYCFNITRKMIYDDHELHQKSTLLEFIKEQYKAKNDQCKYKNPQSIQCLGQVNLAINEAVARLISAKKNSKNT